MPEHLDFLQPNIKTVIHLFVCSNNAQTCSKMEETDQEFSVNHRTELILWWKGIPVWQRTKPAAWGGLAQKIPNYSTQSSLSATTLSPKTTPMCTNPVLIASMLLPVKTRAHVVIFGQIGHNCCKRSKKCILSPESGDTNSQTVC